MTWEITKHPISKVFPKLPQFLKFKEPKIPVMLIDFFVVAFFNWESSNKSEVNEHLETHF